MNNNVNSTGKNEQVKQNSGEIKHNHISQTLEQELYFNYPGCNPDRNLVKLQQKYRVSNIKSDYQRLANYLVPVHGTTIERAKQILESGAISPHSTLSKINENVAKDRLNNATDELDFQLGLDQYIFLSMGRTQPGSLGNYYEVLFVFDHAVTEQQNSIIALKEIAEFGALVSPEAISVYKKRFPYADPQKINERATKSYSENIIWGKDYGHLMPQFLQKNYPNPTKYSSDILFPGDKEISHTEFGIKVVDNYWQGPQLQVPGNISTDKIIAMIGVGDNSETDQRSHHLAQQYNIPFLSAKKVLSQSTQIPVDKANITQLYGFVHMLMRDVGVLHYQEKFGQDLEQSMIELWKS